MLYKFRGKAGGDVIMLAPHGDALLRLLGREPAPRGIFEPLHMSALLATLESALAQADAEAQARAREAMASGIAPGAESGVASMGAGEGGPPAVGLRQRLWPIIDLLRRSQAAGEPVVWGV